MLNFFENYELRRDELLARIAHELQLDATRLQKMESAYNAIYNLLKNDDEFFSEIEIELYAQGSKRIGTTVKPINGDDFDLDIVLHIHDLASNHNPVDIYNALVKALEKDAYYKSILKKKARCVRLDYKGDFHIDILVGCMATTDDLMNIFIPEKSLLSWSHGNPKGFSGWFINISKSMKRSLLMQFSEQLLLKAQIDQEPLPDDEFYQKTPLQTAVQLMKRYRDIYFQNDKEYAVSSIVITTLMGQLYAQQDSIYQTIDDTINKIMEQQATALRLGTKFTITNPVNNKEIFTDSWTDQHYASFFKFITDFHKNWTELKNNFDKSSTSYIQLFGEGQYKQSLQNQIKAMAKFSSDYSTKANSLILSGVPHTDRKGLITENNGMKNEQHHNYGG